MSSVDLQPSLADRLLRPIVFMRPERISDSAWLGHVPFAFWVTEAAKPSCLVELGTHTGASYTAFLQAAARLSVPIRAFAVDTWKGDAHSGTYGEDVLNELRAYHDARYGSFSMLMRMTFDEATAYFEDGSIDLLHIDGYHTYDAVSHDFTRWLPKLSTRAIVLFHDTNVREREFGVWRFWTEQRSNFPAFEFVHGYGLGVLAVGVEVSEPIRWLVSQSADPEATRHVQDFFSALGQSMIELHLRQKIERQLMQLEAQFASLREELTQRTAESASAIAALDDARNATHSAQTERDQSAAALVESKARAQYLEAQLTASAEDNRQLTEQLSQLADQLTLITASRAKLASDFEAVLNSNSWRMTKPLRASIVHSRRVVRRGAALVARKLRLIRTVDHVKSPLPSTTAPGETSGPRDSREP